MVYPLYWKQNELLDGLWHIPMGTHTFCGKDRPIHVGEMCSLTFTEPDICQDCLARETLRLMGRG